MTTTTTMTMTTTMTTTTAAAEAAAEAEAAAAKEVFYPVTALQYCAATYRQLPLHLSAAAHSTYTLQALWRRMVCSVASHMICSVLPTIFCWEVKMS